MSFARIGGSAWTAGFDGERGSGLETGGFMPSPFIGGAAPALITVKAGDPADVVEGLTPEALTAADNRRVAVRLRSRSEARHDVSR